MNKNKTLKSIIVVIVASIVCKLAGLLKQLVIAAYFGTTGEIDTFILVNGTITDLGTAVFTSFSIIYLNQLIRMKKDEEQTKIFNTKVLAYFSLISFVISFLIFTFSSEIIRIIAPGLTLDLLEKGSKYLLVLSPTIVLICFRSILATILDSNRHFFFGKSLGLIQSVTIILTIIFFHTIVGIDSLVFATVVSLIIEIIFGMVILIHKKELKFGKTNLIFDNNLKILFLSMIPLLVSNTVSEINALIDRGIASNLGEGYISAISYAQTLKQFVFSVIVTSIATVMFTDFSNDVSNGRYDRLSNRFSNYFSMYVILLIPISVITVFNSTEIISLVFKRGEFDDNSVALSSQALIGYGAGFIFFAVETVLLRAYYSVGNTRFPLVATIVGIIAGIAFKLVLTNYIGVLGITMASSITYLVTSAVLLIGLRKKVCNINWNKMIVFVAKMAVITTLLSIIAYFLNRIIFVHYFAKIVIITLAIFIIYVLLLLLINRKEFILIIDIFKKKFIKKGKNV